MQPVIILGCGPAGLFAAQAIVELGGDFTIFSHKKKSELYGAQFLHQPIPGLTNPVPDGQVSVQRRGTREAYAKRVYGDPTTPTSWSVLDQESYPAWDLRAAYDRAWEKFEPAIIDTELDAGEVASMTAFFATVISTVPAWAICRCNHIFESISILVSPESIFEPDEDPEENFIVYNGTSEDGWYRSSSVFGHEATETVATDHSGLLFHEHSGSAPRIIKPKYESGFKVVRSNCDCHPNLVRAGRLGEWKRGVLTHHAYEKAVAAYTGALVQ